jgi:hypothetical protein
MEDYMTNHPLSRRVAITGLCAAAVAVPVVAQAEPHPDAELIELGKEYSKLIDMFEDAYPRWAPLA